MGLDAFAFLKVQQNNMHELLGNLSFNINNILFVFSVWMSILLFCCFLCIICVLFQYMWTDFPALILDIC